MRYIEQCVKQLKAYRGFLPVFLEDELFEKAEKELQELKAIQVEAKVSDDCERKFTEDEVMNLVRAEFTEAFKEDKNPEDFTDELYTIFGIIRSALNRKS